MGASYVRQMEWYRDTPEGQKAARRQRLVGIAERELLAKDLAGESLFTIGLQDLREASEKLDSLLSNPRILLNEHAPEFDQDQIDTHLTPLILDAKRAVLDRMSFIENEISLQEILKQADNLKDVNDRTHITAVLRQMEERLGFLEEQRKETAVRIEEARAVAVRDISPLDKVKVFEQKWEVWRRILARESIATIIGGLLLIALATVIIVAMFVRVSVNEILTNSFLLILGYFFGQKAPASRPEDTKGTS